MPTNLPYTDDDAANELLSEDPLALVIGLVLYQQVPTEKAFAGPYALQQRLGHLDPGKIAAMDPDALGEVFSQKPAIHRFPASMAKRIHALCAYVAESLDGDVTKVWTQADDAKSLVKRLTKMPGFGEYKARVFIGVLGRRLGVQPAGWEEYAPDWPSIADIETRDDVAELKERKAAWKAGQKS